MKRQFSAKKISASQPGRKCGGCEQYDINVTALERIEWAGEGEHPTHWQDRASATKTISLFLLTGYKSNVWNLTICTPKPPSQLFTPKHNIKRLCLQCPAPRYLKGNPHLKCLNWHTEKHSSMDIVWLSNLCLLNIWDLEKSEAWTHRHMCRAMGTKYTGICHIRCDGCIRFFYHNTSCIKQL